MPKNYHLNKCVDFLLLNNKIKESDIKDIKIVYRAIEITNVKLFCELKKELIENDWIA